MDSLTYGKTRMEAKRSSKEMFDYSRREVVIWARKAAVGMWSCRWIQMVCVGKTKSKDMLYGEQEINLSLLSDFLPYSIFFLHSL